MTQRTWTVPSLLLGVLSCSHTPTQPRGSEFTPAQIAEVRAVAVACSTAVADSIMGSLGFVPFYGSQATNNSSARSGAAATPLTSLAILSALPPAAPSIASNFPVGTFAVEPVTFGRTYRWRAGAPYADSTLSGAPANGVRIMLRRFRYGDYTDEEIGYMDVVDSLRSPIRHVTGVQIWKLDGTLFGNMRATHDSTDSGTVDVVDIAVQRDGQSVRALDSVWVFFKGNWSRQIIRNTVPTGGYHDHWVTEVAHGPGPYTQTFDMALNGKPMSFPPVRGANIVTIYITVKDGAGNAALGDPNTTAHMGDLASPVHPLGKVLPSMRDWMNALGTTFGSEPYVREIARWAQGTVLVVNRWATDPPPP